MKTKLSVLIVNYKNENVIFDCLKSILKFAPQFKFEVLILNNSKHNIKLKKICDNNKNFFYFCKNKNFGFARGNNFLAKKSKGDFMAIVNPDIKLEEKVFEKLILFLEKNKKIKMVGPKLKLEDDSIQESFRKFPSIFDLMKRRIFAKKTKIIAKTKKVDWLVGAFLVMEKDIFFQLGLFDERYFLFMEDADLCRKFKEKKYEIYFYSEVYARHSTKRLSDTKGFFSFFRWVVILHIFSMLKYFLKWGFFVNFKK